MSGGVRHESQRGEAGRELQLSIQHSLFSSFVATPLLLLSCMSRRVCACAIQRPCWCLAFMVLKHGACLSVGYKYSSLNYWA